MSIGYCGLYSGENGKSASLENGLEGKRESVRVERMVI
jgi:hypothetical protein